MPFGARRFTQLVYQETQRGETRYGEYVARFAPCDLGGVAEMLTEAELRMALDANAQRTPWPLPDLEEKLALRAFTQQQRGKPFDRPHLKVLPASSLPGYDAVDPETRATLERFRALLLRERVLPKTTPPTTSSAAALHSSQFDFADTARRVLAILDHYFPKIPKG